MFRYEAVLANLELLELLPYGGKMGSEEDGLTRIKLSSFSTLAAITIILDVQNIHRTEPHFGLTKSGKAGIDQSYVSLKFSRHF